MKCAYHRFLPDPSTVLAFSRARVQNINNFLFLLAARNITDTDTTTTGGTGDIVCVTDGSTDGLNGASQMGCCTCLTTVNCFCCIVCFTVKGSVLAFVSV